MSVGVGGSCNRCGYCCKVGISIGLMKDKETDYCRYMTWEDGLSSCIFRMGVTEPRKAYEYWLRACKPFPRNYGDIRSVQSFCSYVWGVADG